jgi:ABC-type taurine transport system substrate-binding protein
MTRWIAIAAALACMMTPAAAGVTLRVGDQKGGNQSLLSASGELAGLPYQIEWSEFPAAAPLLEALNAGAIDVGYVGNAPFLFAYATGVPARVSSAVHQNSDGLAIMVPAKSPIQRAGDLRGRRIGTGRGSIGHTSNRGYVGIGHQGTLFRPAVQILLVIDQGQFRTRAVSSVAEIAVHSDELSPFLNAGEGAVPNSPFCAPSND